ncbi:MAG: nuclear transport factor 2 family protein [Armatimonadetes bacterium]|nr:nuclear transport factor 2 family protein [Armatimonadota bacterium]
MKTVTKQQHHVDVVAGLYEAFNRGDIETILRSLTPNVDWQFFTVSLALRGSRRGPAGVQQFFQNMVSAYHFDHCTPRRLLADGNTVVVLGDLRARVNENGRILEMTFVHVCGMKDGKIDTWRGYEESEKVIEAFS